MQEKVNTFWRRLWKRAWQSLRRIGNSSIKFDLFKTWNSLVTPTALPRFRKAHMTFSEWREAIQRQDLVWLDLFRLGVMIIRNSCIEYFHAKAQKLQKVWRSKAQENAIEGVVELDVWGCQSYTLCREFQRTSCESRLSRAFFDGTNKYTCVGESILLKVYFPPVKERSWNNEQRKPSTNVS